MGARAGARAPAIARQGDSAVLPLLERRWVWLTFAALLLFASANQYSRLQFNSGFRYLLPLVPLLMLVAADHWLRLGRGAGSRSPSARSCIPGSSRSSGNRS